MQTTVGWTGTGLHVVVKKIQKYFIIFLLIDLQQHNNNKSSSQYMSVCSDKPTHSENKHSSLFLFSFLQHWEAKTPSQQTLKTTARTRARTCPARRGRRWSAASPRDPTAPPTAARPRSSTWSRPAPVNRSTTCQVSGLDAARPAATALVCEPCVYLLYLWSPGYSPLHLTWFLSKLSKSPPIWWEASGIPERLEVPLRVACFFLPVIHSRSYFRSPSWSQSDLLSEPRGVALACALFFFLLSNIILSKLCAPPRRAFWFICAPEESRCAVIMHQYFLTIFWPSRGNRCSPVPEWFLSLANPFSLLRFVFINVISLLTSYYCCASPPPTVWTIYALAALLILTVIAMVAKLLLHITVKWVWGGAHVQQSLKCQTVDLWCCAFIGKRWDGIRDDVHLF